MFKGSIVALITPFTKELELDVKALRDLIEWHIEEGTDAIMCCGTTGESPTLSHEEKMQIFQIAVETARGRVPIIAGTGTYDTRVSVQNTKEAKELGVDGCLIVVPYYNRPTPEGCLAHYREVSKVGLPFIIYHHPARTGITLSAENLAEIASLPHAVGIKEGSGGLEITKRLRELTNVPVFSGDDDITLSLMDLGAAGGISIVANVIPGIWKQIVQTRSQSLCDQVAPLFKSLVIETNPQGVKYALSLLKRSSAFLRLPMVQPRQSTKEQIEQALSMISTFERELR